MAYDKSENSERPKRDFRPQGGDKKAFISKFKRKEGGGSSSESKPPRKEERNSAAEEPRKRTSRPDEDRKPSYSKRPGPSSFSRGEKPRYTDRKNESGERRKFNPDEKRGSFSKGPRKSFDKPFEKRSDKPFERKFDKPFEKRSDKPFEKRFEKRSDKPFEKKEGDSFERPLVPNRAFSAEKKYFKKKPDSEGGEGVEKKRPFDKDSRVPNRGKSKSFGPPRFGKPRKFASTKRDVMTEGPKDGLIRLNKFISNSGVCSRREADERIKMGLVSVNGKVITEMGHKVKPTDDVRYESTKLHAEKPVYVLMNKPKGFITTTEDPQERKTVMSLIGGAVKERVYPVGRLDRNTTGLLLLTNDGDLADKLTHPSYKAKKIYKVELDKPLTKADFDKIVSGVRLEEGKAIVDDLAYVDDDRMNIGIELHIGWNRIVRRIFESLEYEVVKLDRVVYAGLDKKNLGRGEWRYLSQEEIVKLKHLNKG